MSPVFLVQQLIGLRDGGGMVTSVGNKVRYVRLLDATAGAHWKGTMPISRGGMSRSVINATYNLLQLLYKAI